MFDIVWAFVTNAVGSAGWTFRDLHQAIGTYGLVLSLPILFAVFRLFLVPILGEAVGTSDGSLNPGSIIAYRVRSSRKKREWKARKQSGKKKTAQSGKKKTASAGKNKKANTSKSRSGSEK